MALIRHIVDAVNYMFDSADSSSELTLSTTAHSNQAPHVQSKELIAGTPEIVCGKSPQELKIRCISVMMRRFLLAIETHRSLDSPIL